MNISLRHKKAGLSLENKSDISINAEFNENTWELNLHVPNYFCLSYDAIRMLKSQVSVAMVT